MPAGRTGPDLNDFDFDDGGRRGSGPGPLDWLLFALTAVRRRKLAFAAVFLAGAGATVAFFLLKPPTYRVETRILAQRPQALPSVVRPAYEDVPTRSAWETIHRRENLIAVIRQTHLLGPSTPAPAPEKAPAPSAGDTPVPGDPPHLAEAPRPAGAAAAPRPDDDPLDALVTVLDKRLTVTTDEGTITVSLDWRDPQAAYDIVQAVLINFLEARHVQEVTAIDEVISVLQGRASALRQELDTVTEEARRRVARPARPVVARVRQPSEELVRLQSLWEAKRRAIQDVEEFRRRRLSDLQAQLDQALTTFSESHPTVVRLRNDIETASRESPQAATLREDERKAHRTYSDQLAREGFPTAGAAAAAAATPAEATPSIDEDDRVRHARLQFEQMLGRVNAAQVELDAARAAFKYRYNVIWPPQVPKEPISPNPKKIFPMGLLASLVLALAAAVAPDLWSGRILERWQVERSLGLPVIGEIRRKR